MARGLVQMVFVGVVLAVLLHGSLLIGVLILLADDRCCRGDRRAPRPRASRARLLLSFLRSPPGPVW